MKKIINGRKYDTDTAELVAEWDNGDYGDFDFVREGLYRKRTGEYFLYGRGGAQTRYALACSATNWGGGEGFAPLAEDEARKWAEEHCDGDEYEQIFGEVEE